MMQLPNLLNMALQVVGTQTFQYFKNTGREPNTIGQDVATYAPPVNLTGQVQAVPRDLYLQYGLNFQKNYLIFYVSKDILDVERDLSGDQMKYAGNTFQSLSKTDWFAMNGWDSIMAVEV